MNWKNVLRLIRIDAKSGRLIKGQEFRRYRERRIYTYLLYGGACIIGLIIGLAIGNFYQTLNYTFQKDFHEYARQIFASLPTLILLYSLILTMMGQIQRSGIRASIQPPYWLPITWEEHTLASILAHIVGLPLASLIFLGSLMGVLSVFLGEAPIAILTILALFASAFLASTTTEIFRVLQVRLIGAIYKSTGKTAIYVRFIGTLLFLIAFYIVWFFVTSGQGLIAFIEAITGVQGAVWFIPYVWLGIALASFINGLALQTIIFWAASLLFLLTLFYLAVRLNTKFGLYEPPAITVSRGGYTPKVGILGKLGFSSLEAAVIRKDFKAFTRRRELMYIFIMPIIFIIMPLMQYSGMLGNPVQSEAAPFLYAWMLLAPGVLMVITLGMIIIGEEGSSIWLFYSSPITAHSLVKCKYAFICITSCLVTLACGVIGILIARPSIDVAITLLTESLLLIFALGAVSLRAGIDGADFVEAPRPRMVKPLVSFVNMLVCFILAAIILAPIIPYLIISVSLPVSLPLPYIGLPFAVFISTVIAVVITFVFYRVAVKSAEKLLLKAKM